jgi:hypothetical protein
VSEVSVLGGTGQVHAGVDSIIAQEFMNPCVAVSVMVSGATRRSDSGSINSKPALFKSAR